MVARGAQAASPLTHHDLCFGCGLANVFGLQLELARTGDGGVSGRFFVKQDHEGRSGVAHPGVLAAALEEAMALAAGEAGFGATERLEVDLHAPAPVGSFLRVEAAVERREADRLELRAAARTIGHERRLVAEARAVLSTAGGGGVEAPATSPAGGAVPPAR